MKKLIFSIFLALYCLQCFAQIKIHEPGKIYYHRDKSIEVEAFFDPMIDNDRSSNFSYFQKSIPYTKDNIRFATRYKQFINNLPVIGAEVILHSIGNIVERSTGISYPLPDYNHKFEENENIYQVAKLHFIELLMTTNGLDLSTSKEFISVTTLKNAYIDQIYPSYSGVLAPCFIAIVEVLVGEQPISLTLYIDAVAGHLIFANDNITHGTIPTKGATNYYNLVDIQVDSISPSRYELKDNSRGVNIIVKDYTSQNVVFSENKIIDFEDEGQRSAVDVLYGTQQFYDLLQSKFKFNSLDNNGYNLVANVNRKLYNNAFWNGRTSNYGAGDCYTFKPFTSIDIIGHEFAHGITSFNSKLIYSGESGAINESFSDIIGKALEYFTHPENFSWQLGNIISRSNKAFRTMNNPYTHKHPKYYKGQYWENRNFLSLGVHTNSGVGNYWFYLLCEGEKSVNEANFEYDVKSIGWHKALEIVFHTHINYIIASSNYLDYYQFTLQAAQDLYPDDMSVYASVKEAWKAVGITDALIISEPIEKRFKLDVSGLANGDKMCDKKLNELQYRLHYVGKEQMPQVEALTIEVIASYLKELENNQILKVEEVIGSQTYLNLSSVNFNDRFEVVNATLKSIDPDSIFSVTGKSVNLITKVTLKLMGEDMIFSLPSQTLHIISTNVEPSHTFRYRSKYGLPIDKCNYYGGFSNLRYTFTAAVCPDELYPFKIRLLGFDGLVDEFITYEKPVSGSFSEISLNGLHLAVNNSVLSNSVDKVLQIFSLIDGDEFLLLVDSLNQYFGPFLNSDSRITFDQPSTDNVFITVSKCSQCELDFNQNHLFIRNTISDPINDCIDLQEYIDFLSTNSASVFNNINFCFLDELDPNIDIYVSFRMRLSVNNPYNNYTRFYQNGINSAKYDIETTGGNWSNVKIPLSRTNADPLSLRLNVLLQNAELYLDDIAFVREFVATNDFNKNKILGCTNPVDHTLRIFKNIESKDITYRIYDIEGRYIYEDIITDEDKTLDVSNWNSGMYILKYITGETSQTLKFIIVRH